MVEESVEHAFEDLAARRWVEARLKAEQIIAATRKALSDCNSELEPGYRIQIETALKTAESAMIENPQTKIGDTKTLQTACAALDEITKPLAEVLMNRAMDALLRKRGVI
jgi:molecular chaperone DnaK (HSP70)